MKTKISTIYLLLAFTVITFIGCSKDGVERLAGLDGQNATLYY